MPPPPQFSRRRRRWVHHQVKAMRCFTDEEIVRGLDAVCARKHDLDEIPEARLLAIFLAAAQPTAGQTDDDWPATHPMHCRSCGRALTDPSGTALVRINIVERQWRCQQCTQG